MYYIGFRVDRRWLSAPSAWPGATFSTVLRSALAYRASAYYLIGVSLSGALTTITDDVSTGAQRAELLASLDDYLLGGLVRQEPGTDQLRLWLDSAISVVSQPAGLQQLQTWLRNDKAKGWTIDPDRRWSILRSLSANGVAGSIELAEAERLVDSSDKAERGLLAVQAIWPDEASKRR